MYVMPTSTASDVTLESPQPTSHTVCMDFVFTVCDQAAGEVCPVWPGNPITAHWGVPDPAGVEGTVDECKRAFRNAYHQLDGRIRLFIALPIDKLDRMALKRRTDEIGRKTTTDEAWAHCRRRRHRAFARRRSRVRHHG
jgi:hypothetical protein